MRSEKRDDETAWRFTRVTHAASRFPAAAEIEDGFAVVWEGDTTHGDDPDASVQGRRLDSHNKPLDPRDLQVNCGAPSRQIQPRVASLPGGRSATVWWDLGTGDTYLRILEEPPLFSDGFESGDTSAWSTTVP